MHIACSLNLWLLVPRCYAFKRWHLSVISLYGLARLVALRVACKQEIEPDKRARSTVFTIKQGCFGAAEAFLRLSASLERAQQEGISEL